MLGMLRRYREMRPASVLVIVAALIVGSYNVHRALGFGSRTEQASLAAEKLRSSGDISLDWLGDPVLTKAEVSTLKSVEKLTRIEELQVGERIRSDAPTEEFDLQFGKDIIRSDWRKLTLVAPKRDGSSADVVLLRPLQWLNEQQAEVGGTVFISVPECGIDGHADVLAIEPCPEIEPAGDLGGRVITGTFRHQVSASISLSIAGQPEPILCTGNHPFWSEDRQDFVRADSLQPNETLRTTTGTTTVTSLSHVPGSTPVYNLEIHGTHVYHVGTSGVLVHNGNDLCPDAEALFNPLLRTRPGLEVSARNLQKVFGKHGADFGLQGNWNPSRAMEVFNAILGHMTATGTRRIPGLYRGQDVIHYVDPVSGLNVFTDLSGNFVGGWKLHLDQLQSVLSTGRLF